jgi:hypothetical protein
VQERAATSEQAGKLALAQARQHRDVRTHPPLEPTTLWPLANDDEPFGSALECPKSQIHTLARDESRHEQKRTVARGPRLSFGGAFEAACIDGRLDHERVAPVVTEDALARVRAVGDEHVRPRRRNGLPSPQVVCGAAEERATQRTARNAGLVRRLSLTHVAQSGVHIGHVKSRGRGDRAHGHAVAARKDEIVGVEVE